MLNTLPKNTSVDHTFGRPSVGYENVTPEIAAQWLKANVVNRSLRDGKVNQYADDMASGNWTVSESAICFARDGSLLNGQHRLTAIVAAGVTVTMLVARNMPPESMKNMDSGSARGAADALTFEGEKYAALLAAITKLAIIAVDGRIYKDRKVQAVSNTAVIDFINAHPLLRHSAEVASNDRRGIDCPPSVIGAAHWLIARSAGTSVADHYLHQLATRTGEPEGSAVLAVDSRLRQLRRHKAKYSSRGYLALLVKGWNYYARDIRIASVTISDGARIPTPSQWQR